MIDFNVAADAVLTLGVKQKTAKIETNNIKNTLLIFFIFFTPCSIKVHFYFNIKTSKKQEKKAIKPCVMGYI